MKRYIYTVCTLNVLIILPFSLLWYVATYHVFDGFYSGLLSRLWLFVLYNVIMIVILAIIDKYTQKSLQKYANCKQAVASKNVIGRALLTSGAMLMGPAYIHGLEMHRFLNIRANTPGCANDLLLMFSYFTLSVGFVLFVTKFFELKQLGRDFNDTQQTS